MNGVGVPKHHGRVGSAGGPSGLGRAARRQWPTEVLAFGGMLLRSGGLIPVAVAARLLGVSRQRVYALMGQRVLKREVVWGLVLVVYPGVVEYAETERRAGRRVGRGRVQGGGSR